MGYAGVLVDPFTGYIPEKPVLGPKIGFKAPWLVRAYPDLDCEDKLIIPGIRRVARDVVSRYEAVMLAETRQEIGYEILQRLQENLDADPTIGGAFTIDEVYVRNIRLPQKFVEAIQEKLAAQQRIIAAQYERNTTLILANGTRFIVILSPQGDQLPLLYPVGEG